MQLNSYLFILLFLPAVLPAFSACCKRSHRLGKRVLILASALFYIPAGWQCWLILGIGAMLTWLSGVQLHKDSSRTLFRFAVGAHLLLLGVCKYYGFFLNNLNAVFSLSLPVQQILLPLGISFYTFQQIAFLADCKNGVITPDSFEDYLLYVLFFPKLLMGPLAQPKQLLAEFQAEVHPGVTADNLVSGIQLFAFGLFKKTVLADVFAQAASAGFTGIAGASTVQLWAAAVSYSMQIYFDFSGYSDMAIGCAKMLGYALPMNFDSPYQALSIRDFWKRWHISLTRFFTRYLYIPLGGSRNGDGITIRNTMIVFLLSGLWHGANWTFVLWGLLHGLLSVGERFWGQWTERMPKAIRWVITFLLVTLLWTLFRADSVSQWLQCLQGMFCFRGGILSADLTGAFHVAEWKFLLRIPRISHLVTKLPWIPMASIMGLSFVLCLCFPNTCRQNQTASVLRLLLCAAAMILGMCTICGEAVFVYMNF